MKNLSKALFAAVVLGASASAQAWYWGAPVYAPVYGPTVALSEEQQQALAAQQQAAAEQQRALFEQQAAAQRQLVDAQRALWEEQARQDAELLWANPWSEHVGFMQDAVRTDREMLEEMRARRQESRERFQAAREEARKRRADRL